MPIFKKYLDIYLTALGLTCGIQHLFLFVCFSKWNFFSFFSCSMWDLVLWPGIKLGPPALGAKSLSHWTTREVPKVPIISLLFLWGPENRSCFPVCLEKKCLYCLQISVGKWPTYLSFGSPIYC